MKQFITALFFLSFALKLIALDLIDDEGRNLTLNGWETSDLSECEEVFIDAFSKAYEKFSESDLDVENKLLFLKEAFEDLKQEALNNLQDLLVAKYEGKVVGLIGFKQTELPGQYYISQLAVAPKEWKRGIGKHLVFSALNLYQDAQSLVVIPRRINTVARNFYHKLGFQESSYMHPGYDPQKYVGYEWTRCE